MYIKLTLFSNKKLFVADLYLLLNRSVEKRQQIVLKNKVFYMIS
jgi:hypothetical protein